MKENFNRPGKGLEDRPEADDEANDDLDGRNEPTDKVGSNNRLDDLSIRRKTVQKLTNANCVEESNVLAKHVTEHQGTKTARAARSRNGVQHTREKREERICNINSKKDKSDPVELVLTHAQIGEADNINEPSDEKVLRHVQERADGGEEGRGNNKRKLGLSKLEQTQGGDLLWGLVLLSVLLKSRRANTIS